MCRPASGCPSSRSTYAPAASYLHPRYVAVLLNDLFGIQSRAGCSCAAPYGHRLLHIDGRTSRELRRTIMCGNVGLKPGWARVNFHFLHTEAEVDFLLRAILFIAEHGADFLPLYAFDMRTGAWHYRDPASPRGKRAPKSTATRRTVEDEQSLARMFDGYLAQAERRAAALRARPPAGTLRTTQEGPVPFVYVERE